jgi:hypothetical protein
MESEPVSCFIRINADHELPKVKQTLEEANKTLSCWVGPTQTRNASALLYGDSHAAAYAGQLQAFSEAVGGAFYYMGQNGCGAVGNPEENKAKSCALVRAAALEASESFDWVIIAQAWSHYNSFQDTFDGIKALVTKLVQSGKNVILLGEVPHTNTAGACPLMLTNVTTQDEKRRCLGEHHLRWWRERSWNMNSYLEGLSHAFPRVWYWDPNYYMCMDGVCSRYNSMGLLMYVDGTHRGWRRGMMDGQEIVRKWGVPECFVAAFRSKNGGKQTCFRVPNEPDDGGQAIGNDFFSTTGPCAPMQLRS